jgi:ABC-type uncharacterized transport system permease subunit
MKKLLTALTIIGGLFIGKICLGVSTIFTWSASNTTDLTAWIGQVWSDFSIPILLVVGVSLGFVVIRKLISLAKGGLR